jgi:hypothetical protein
LRRLALKLPTALQTKPNHALLFCEEGVKAFVEPDSPGAYAKFKPKAGDFQNRIWALVDSDQQVHRPALVFQQKAFFVVEASSPCPARHEWTDRIEPKFFYMKLWSFSEVLQA